MRRTVAIVGLLLSAACSEPTVQAGRVNRAVFDGARVIVGDGSAPIEDAVFVVDAGRFVQIGRRGEVQVPAGATRVDLTGKTVMPAIVDTHTHMPTTREALIDGLQRKAYYGVGAVASLGQDTGDVAFQVREEIVPDRALLRTAGRGITMPEPGRTEAPYWVTNEAEARKAVQELAARKVDFVKIWVDDRDGKYKKARPQSLRRDHRRSAQERTPRHRSHLHARRCEGTVARGARRVCAQRARSRHRRGGIGAVQAACKSRRRAQPA